MNVGMLDSCFFYAFTLGERVMHVFFSDIFLLQLFDD